MDRQGNEFKGIWKDDWLTGQGTHVGPEGSYVGNWDRGRKNGKGVFTWIDGDVYTGTWSVPSIMALETRYIIFKYSS